VLLRVTKQLISEHDPETIEVTLWTCRGVILLTGSFVSLRLDAPSIPDKGTLNLIRVSCTSRVDEMCDKKFQDKLCTDQAAVHLTKK